MFRSFSIPIKRTDTRVKIPNRVAYKILRRYTMRPDALESFKAKIRSNKSFKYALFRNKTRAFNKSLNYATSQVQNIFIIIPGLPGTGKTTTARSLTIEIRDRRLEYRDIDGKIYIAYKQDQLLNIFPKTEQGAIILKDENPIPHGTGSQIGTDAIINFMGVVRDEEISAVLVSPRDYKKGEFGLANIYLLPLGYNTETKVNRCMWIDKAGHYIGLVYIPFKTDAKVKVRMDKLKKGLQDELREFKGNVWSEPDDSLIERDIKTVLKYYKTHPLPPRLSKLGIQRDFWDIGIKGNDAHKDRVAARVYKILYYQKERQDKEQEKMDSIGQVSEDSIKYGDFKEINYTIKPMDAKRDDDLRKSIMNILKKEDDITETDIKVMERIATGETYAKIQADLGLGSPSYITIIKKKIQEKYLGIAGELAYKPKLEETGHEIEYFGGYSHKPDFIDHTDKKVISFKTYTHQNDSYAAKNIGKNE
ncbi:MAG: hypothetical protein GF329_03075, partial [Candidatus Lokiarchaeota archaeon]|nr:hypothetical protein [Candidatus Lokiarchaeota archaeon]